MLKHLPSTIIWGPATSPSIPSFTSSVRMGLSVSTFVSPNRHVPRLAFAPEPVELPIKPDQEDQKTMSMDAFVSKSCPSLYQPYNPPRWMHKYVGRSASEYACGKPCFLTAVTFKPRTALSEISPKSTGLCTAGQLDTALGSQPDLTRNRRKLLRTVDGGTLYVVWSIPPPTQPYPDFCQRFGFYTSSRWRCPR